MQITVDSERRQRPPHRLKDFQQRNPRHKSNILRFKYDQHIPTAILNKVQISETWKIEKQMPIGRYNGGTGGMVPATVAPSTDTRTNHPGSNNKTADKAATGPDYPHYVTHPNSANIAQYQLQIVIMQMRWLCKWPDYPFRWGRRRGLWRGRSSGVAAGWGGGPVPRGSDPGGHQPRAGPSGPCASCPPGRIRSWEGVSPASNIYN